MHGPKRPFLSILVYIVYIGLFGQDMQVLYLGRAPRTKETLPDFLKWRRVTRPPLVFHGLTGSQRTPGFWGVTEKDVPYSHLKVFRCKAFMHVPKEKRSKLDDKATPCIFIGYGDKEFNYMLWDSEKQKTVKIRDVVFHEPLKIWRKR